MFDSFDSEKTPSLRPTKISVLFVTPQNESAHYLSSLLGKASVNIEVEWVDAIAGHLGAVKRRLAMKPADAPSIVLLDYRTCGAAIWSFITGCVRAMPRHKTEWIVSHYTGSPPVLAEFPWRNVTILGDRVISH